MSVDSLPLYNTFLDFLVEKATPEEILAFQASEADQEQVQNLLTKNSAGTLTQTEYYQLEQMRQFEHMMEHLKLKALEAQQK